VKISADELNDSLDYLEQTGFSDFFPEPFEIDAIRHSWPRIRSILEGIDLLDYETKNPYEVTAPKGNWLVRPVKLLNPIDVILFSSLSFRLAPQIQDRRNEYCQGMVFSWNYDSNSHGTKEMFKSDWRGFQEKAEELARANEYVARTDIVDLFPEYICIV